MCIHSIGIDLLARCAPSADVVMDVSTFVCVGQLAMIGHADLC